MVSSKAKAYCLQLANGQSWCLMATDGAKRWLDNLASIMELGTGEPRGQPRLIFVRAEPGKTDCTKLVSGLDKEIQSSIPRDGWKIFDLGWLALWFHPDVSDVICDIGYEEKDGIDAVRKMVFALRPIYLRSQLVGGLPLHAALIERNGLAVLLSASSETGKSTCCRRLPPPWQAWCDDQALVLRDNQERYVAHPFPTWKDYTDETYQRTLNVQRYLPILGIFFLEQSGTDAVIRLEKAPAAMAIYRAISQVRALYVLNSDSPEDRAFQKKFFDNACELARAVPVFTLRASLTGQFWDYVEKAVSEIPKATSIGLKS